MREMMEDKIKALALQIIAAHGYELYNIEFKNSDLGKVLRVYVTGPDGINLDQCAVISRKLNYELDLIDIIPYKYYLEVSSPGLERALLNADHYSKAVNETVKVTYRKEGKTTTAIGILKAFSGNTLSLEITEGKDTRTEEIPCGDIKKARTVFVINKNSRR